MILVKHRRRLAANLVRACMDERALVLFRELQAYERKVIESCEEPGRVRCLAYPVTRIVAVRYTRCELPQIAHDYWFGAARTC
jgi:hypothetical protein